MTRAVSANELLTNHGCPWFCLRHSIYCGQVLAWQW